MKNDTSANDEIDIREVFLVLWSQKLLILLITSIFAMSSVFYALSLPNKYKAEVVLAATDSESGGLSAALGQLGGLASLAGVNIQSDTASESKIAQEIMKSWSFVEQFINDNNISVEVYAAIDWDQTSNRLLINPELFDQDKEEWLIIDQNTGDPRQPSSWELYTSFSQIFSLTQDQKTGLIYASIEYFSPELAKEWLDNYVFAINKHMQNRQVEKVSNNIRYLEDQIDKTSITEMKEVFYTIIGEQTKNKMVAAASPDYAFVTVSPSMIPGQKSGPDRATLCILITLVGAFLSMMIALFMHYLGKKNQV